MAFDVSKFLALTALIATTGYACSSSDKDKLEPSDDGGAPGTAGVTGKSGDAGAPNGAAGAAAGGGGEAGAAVGGAGVGGASGGEGGQGVVVGECIGVLGAAGAGGAAADVDPSLEDLCADLYDVVCAASAEDFAPAYLVCEGVRDRGLTAVAIKVADCLKGLDAAGMCDTAKTAACFTNLVGQGCENPDAVTACASIQDNCDEIGNPTCMKIANLVNGENMYEVLTGCMDPANEYYYDPYFTGTCTERLDYCAGVRLLK